MKLSHLFRVRIVSIIILFLLYLVIYKIFFEELSLKYSYVPKFQSPSFISSDNFYPRDFSNNNKTSVTCFKWIYDIDEWTLTYNNETYKRPSNCPIPSKVKKIVFPNSTSKLVGCTKHTEQCGGPQFDPEFNRCVNTPPCCRSHIMEIVRNFASELDKMGEEYQLAFGGVIGWYRNKKMIPYDGDLDLIVTKKFWNTTKFYTFLDILVSKYGHAWRWYDEGLKLKLWYSKMNHNFIDVWAMRVTEDNEICIDHSDWVAQPVDVVLPSRKDYFEGITMYLPNKPEEYLDNQYGKGKWREPISCEDRYR